LDAIRRRCWRLLFQPAQLRLGSFFIDPQDHIGAERLIMGERYEEIYLQQLAHLIDVLNLKKGVAIDAGANIGNHSCWFASRFAHLLCFEPGKVAGLILEANLLKTGTKNWQIFKYALGEENGYGKLAVINEMNLGSSQVVNVSDSQSEFEVLRGDEALLRTNIEWDKTPLTLIKIDVEGGELSVLKGFKEAIEKYSPLICIEALDEAQWNMAREFLECCGYVFFLAPAVTHSSGSLWSYATTIAAGKKLSMSEIDSVFPTGGYGMIFCLDSKMLAMLQ
jgi:FkbM family methyltransferase